MKLRRKIAAAAITVAALGASAGVAEAHSFGAQGPSHTHYGCTMSGSAPDQCMRWILANGAVIQGPKDLMIAQYGYVLVWCSYGTAAGGGTWSLNTSSWGPWNNTGWHTYCQNPKYSGTAWSLRP